MVLMSRIDDLPVYEQRDDTVDAKLYNLWRRARLHFTMPMRMEFDDMPGVAMILNRDKWVCVNVWQNDLPLLAWVGFQDQGREALHTPVACKLNYYHYAASKYRARVLQLMESELTNRLSDEEKK
jgi:hypothetical protein